MYWSFFFNWCVTYMILLTEWGHPGTEISCPLYAGCIPGCCKISSSHHGVQRYPLSGSFSPSSQPWKLSSCFSRDDSNLLCPLAIIWPLVSPGMCSSENLVFWGAWKHLFFPLAGNLKWSYLWYCVLQGTLCGVAVVVPHEKLLSPKLCQDGEEGFEALWSLGLYSASTEGLAHTAF